jgi:hypothetical protein
MAHFELNTMKYQIGYELLLINGSLSFLGYWILGSIQSNSAKENQSVIN